MKEKNQLAKSSIFFDKNQSGSHQIQQGNQRRQIVLSRDAHRFSQELDSMQIDHKNRSKRSKKARKRESWSTRKVREGDEVYEAE